MRKFCFILTATLFSISFHHSIAQEVDLLWQGKTYTPPFYEGRSLWSKQGAIMLVALPHGLGNSSALNYRWTRNGTVLGNTSGVGKSSLTFFDSILSRPQTIKVEILAADPNVVRASASVTITPRVPTIAVYENHPLFGFMFHKETSSTHVLKEREVVFAAFPLFFSALDRLDDSLKYEWRTNSGGIENKNSVTYRVPENTEGLAEVNLHISNDSKIIQEAKQSFLVQFDSPQNI